MIRHIIFDCFGTLIDTGKGSIQAVEQILQHVDVTVDAKTFYADWKKIKKQMMNGDVFYNEKTLFTLSLAENFQKYGIIGDAELEVQPMIQSLFAQRLVFPDVKDTLKGLTEKGIDYAIGSTTDTDSLLYYLESNQLTFERIYTSEDMQVYKPHPDFYRTILKRTGWKVEECLFVGDSYMDDVYGPKSIGMRAALLDRKGNMEISPLDPAPDYVLQSLKELITVV